MLKFRTGVCIAIFAAALSACGLLFPEEVELRDDHTAVISGRETKDLDPAEARRTALLEAARVTVDHGYQYFIVLRREVWTPSGPVRAGNDSAIRPGDDVTIKVFNEGEVPRGTRDLFDAQRMLTTGVTPAAASAPTYPYGPSYAPVYSPPATTRTSAPPSPKQTPRCTAYGCDW